MGCTTFLFTHPSRDGNSGCDYLLALVNNAAVNIFVELFVWMCVLSSFGYNTCLQVGLIFFWLSSLTTFADHETVDPGPPFLSGSEMVPPSASHTAPAVGSVGPTLEWREGCHGQWLCAMSER